MHIIRYLNGDTLIGGMRNKAATQHLHEPRREVRCIHFAPFYKLEQRIGGMQRKPTSTPTQELAQSVLLRFSGSQITGVGQQQPAGLNPWYVGKTVCHAYIDVFVLR